LTDFQPELDQYLNSPSGTEMPAVLSQYLKAMDYGHMWLNHSQLKEKYNFTELVKSAKEVNIRVVAFDTEASYTLFSSDSPEYEAVNKRYKPMNYLAVQKIQQEKCDGKWIAFVGSAHTATCSGVPGISDILGVPSVVVQDLREDITRDSEGIVTNVYDFKEEKGLNIDVVITLNPDKYLTQKIEPEFGVLISASVHNSTVSSTPITFNPSETISVGSSSESSKLPALLSRIQALNDNKNPSDGKDIPTSKKHSIEQNLQLNPGTKSSS
jgi:hypothetical protein